MKALYLICQQIWKTQQWPQDLKSSVSIPIPKKGKAKECSNYHTIAFISHTSKVMLKSLQAREFQKNIYSCFINYAKAFDCVDHNQLRKILKEMGIPDHLTYLLRNLCAGQEATVRTRHGTTEWFQIGKGVCQGCILSLCLFNLYAEYISWHAGQDEAQTWIKIAGRNINNIRYADDTTLMTESEDELKASWCKWKWRVKKLA